MDVGMGQQVIASTFLSSIWTHRGANDISQKLDGRLVEDTLVCLEIQLVFAELLEDLCNMLAMFSLLYMLS